MVEIRKLEPLIKIRQPGEPKRPTVHREVMRVERRRGDYLPPTPQRTPCVLWQGSVDPDGYGRMKVLRNKRSETVKIHRYIMELFLGRKLSRDEFILHLCDNPPCYRLDHLRVGDAYDNNHDMMRKGRHVGPPVHHNGRRRAELTAWQRERIRRDYRNGIHMTSLADVYGVSYTTIQRIVAGIRPGSDGRDLLAEARERIAAALAERSGDPSTEVLPGGSHDEHVFDQRGFAHPLVLRGDVDDPAPDADPDGDDG